MNAALLAALSGLSTVIIKEWELWRERQGQPQGWVPTEDDIQKFLSEIDWATPANVREAARKELEATGVKFI